MLPAFRALAPRLLLASALLLPSLAAAQTPPDTASGPRAARVRAALAQVPPGEQVRVAPLPAGLPPSFRLHEVMRDTLVLRTNVSGERFRLALADVEQVDVRSGSQAGKGARIGAGVGAAALGALSALFIRALCDIPDCSFGRDEWNGVLAGAALGGAGGALLGAGIGSLVPRWRQLVP